MPWRGSPKPPAEPVVKPYGCDSYVHLNLKMEDYYRIKDAQKEQEKK